MDAHDQAGGKEETHQAKQVGHQAPVQPRWAASALRGFATDALAAIEQTQAVPAHRTFWWAATGLIESLLHKGLDNNVNLKQLCGGIDQQIRRLAEGSSKVAERLLRDVLYFVARSKPVASRVEQIQDLFELGEREEDMVTVKEKEVTAPASCSGDSETARDVLTWIG